MVVNWGLLPSLARNLGMGLARAGADCVLPPYVLSPYLLGGARMVQYLTTPHALEFLDLALRSRDVRYLIVTGVVTDVCVNATLMSAASRDYRVTAVTDGVATLWPELQAACFEIWKRKFARLRTTAEVLEEIGAFTSEGVGGGGGGAV